MSRAPFRSFFENKTAALTFTNDALNTVSGGSITKAEGSNTVVYTPSPSRVYFSIQLNTNATGGSGTTALTGSLWNSSTLVASPSQENFTSNGFIVPYTGVYKIDCYQTITNSSRNSASSSLVVKNGSTTLAQSREGEVNPQNTGYTSPPVRSESVTWLGTLSANDAITFEIQCDGGFTLNSNHGLGCYTIVSVD